MWSGGPRRLGRGKADRPPWRHDWPPPAPSRGWRRGGDVECGRSAGAAGRQTPPAKRNGPRTLTRMTSSHCSAAQLVHREGVSMAALFTRMSMRPSRRGPVTMPWHRRRLPHSAAARGPARWARIFCDPLDVSGVDIDGQTSPAAAGRAVLRQVRSRAGEMPPVERCSCMRGVSFQRAGNRCGPLSAKQDRASAPRAFA